MLDWLAAEPGDDPVADLAAMRSHLASLADADLSAAKVRRCVEQLDRRALDISGRLRSRLMQGSLPLPRTLYQPSLELVGALLDTAASFQRLIDDARGRWVRTQRIDPQTLAGRALDLVSEAFLVAGMAGMAAPFGLWQRAHALILAAWRLDGGGESGDATPRGAAFSYKRLLALAAVQPESLSARELAWVFDYLEGAAALAELTTAPILPGNNTYWIDPAQDIPPVAVVRRQAPGVDGLLYFSAHQIGRRAAEQIESLELRLTDAVLEGAGRDGEFLDPERSGLPEGLAPKEALALLRRIRDRWITPPHREQPRRRHQYTVQVCVGLKAIWDLSRAGSNARFDEWMVYNESPGGYAIMSVAGISGSLNAGMALALRRDPSQPWAICIVRWIRADNPDQVEIGLQVVSQAFTPVSVGFRGGDVATPVAALILPPMTAVRCNQAILAPAGTYTARRFVILHEGERLYVAQARVLSLDMQTASVELFQYEIDPYPI